MYAIWRYVAFFIGKARMETIFGSIILDDLIETLENTWSPYNIHSWIDLGRQQQSVTCTLQNQMVPGQDFRQHTKRSKSRKGNLREDGHPRTEHKTLTVWYCHCIVTPPTTFLGSPTRERFPEVFDTVTEGTECIQRGVVDEDD